MPHWRYIGSFVFYVTLFILQGWWQRRCNRDVPKWDWTVRVNVMWLSCDIVYIAGLMATKVQQRRSGVGLNCSRDCHVSVMWYCLHCRADGNEGATETFRSGTELFMWMSCDTLKEDMEIQYSQIIISSGFYVLKQLDISWNCWFVNQSMQLFLYYRY